MVGGQSGAHHIETRFAGRQVKGAGCAGREEDEEEGTDEFSEVGAEVVVHEALECDGPAYSNADAEPSQGGTIP